MCPKTLVYNNNERSHTKVKIRKAKGMKFGILINAKMITKDIDAVITMIWSQWINGAKVAARRKMKTRALDNNIVEVPLDVPSSVVVGTLLDPLSVKSIPHFFCPFNFIHF